jgi:hypothetical protein
MTTIDKQAFGDLAKILAPGIAAFAENQNTASKLAETLATSQNKSFQAATTLAKSTRLNIILGRIVAVMAAVFAPMAYVIVTVFFFLAPYIALIIIILLIFGAFRFALRPSGRSNREPSIWDRFKRIFKFSYGTKKVLRKVGGKQNMNGIPRPILSDGSCDEFEWRSVGGNKCQRMLVPKPIEWTLDENNVTDLNELPDVVSSSLIENRTLVKIPWVEKKGVYVPQCKAAIYPDDNNSPAGYLFDSEDDTKCKKAVKASKSYTLEYRPKDAPSLDTYASSKSPMCME